MARLGRAFPQGATRPRARAAGVTPTVTLISETRTTISRVSPYDLTDVTWQADGDFSAYQLRVVPSSISDVTAGTLIEQDQNPPAGGSANTQYVSTITDAELEAASAGEGAKLVKLFVLGAATGDWST